MFLTFFLVSMAWSEYYTEIFLSICETKVNLVILLT